MKRLFLHFLPVMFLIGGLGLSEAVEIELTGGLNTYSFKAPSEENSKKNNFLSNIIGNFSVKGDITGSTSFYMNINRDNIQHNSLNIRFSTRSDFFKFEFGPFFGLSDDNKFDMGFLGLIELTFPGIIFFSFSGTATISRSFSFTSDNSRESVEAKLGFWLPIVIPSVTFNLKNYSQEAITNNLTRIFLSADFYSKTSPVTFRIDAGYEILKQIITGEENIKKQNAVFTGIEIIINIAKARIIAGAEIPFNLPFNSSQISYKAYAGFGYSFN